MCPRTRALGELRRFWADESGPAATEYAVLLALIVLVAAASIRAVGESLFGIWQAIDGAVSTTSTAP